MKRTDWYWIIRNEWMNERVKPSHWEWMIEMKNALPAIFSAKQPRATQVLRFTTTETGLAVSLAAVRLSLS